MKAPKGTSPHPLHPVPLIIAKIWDIGKEIGTNLSASGAIPPSNQQPSEFPILKELQGLFPILPLNWVGETFLQIGDKSFPL